MQSTAAEPSSTRRPSGVQSVDRALLLLELVAQAPPTGARLSDLAEAAGLDPTTAHRLLAALVLRGLVQQERGGRRYQLGLGLFSLAAAASNRLDLTGVARDALLRIAEDSGETAYLCLSAGADVVCLEVVSGSFPIRALPMDVGSRQPLGASAAGLAVLAALPEVEARTMVAGNLRRLRGVDETALLRSVSDARRDGYALSLNGAGGLLAEIAVPLINRRGRPQGALAVAALAERLDGERRVEVAGVLVREARVVEEAMWRLPDGQRHRATWFQTAGSPAR